MGRPPVALIVMDGFGLAPPGPGNAVDLADTPVFDALWQRYPHTELIASGEAVGLPPGQIGNSEVGHLNLGAGRRVLQKQTYIQALIDEGAFFDNPVLLDLLRQNERGGALHLMGLVSDGGVHSDLSHLFALLDLAERHQVAPIYLHIFTDGRDVGPSTGLGFVRQVAARLATMRDAHVATVSGRYYAMDRDKRWERTRRAYDALVCGRSDLTATDPAAAVQAAYDRGESDEFIQPTVVTGADGAAIGTLNDGDALLFFNFRADRARQMSYALLNPDFDGFERCRVVGELHYATLMAYADDIPVPYAFDLPSIEMPLAAVLAEAGRSQYHSAETEKYAHVTFFFNATREAPYEGESRTMIPSPKVATYDLQPEMSAPALAAATVDRLRTADDDFLLVNFANPDMVGHTGIIAAAIAACEASDAGLGQILTALREKGGRAIIVADHGNAEVMIAEDGGPHTAHTTNPVPCILVDDDFVGGLREGGSLGDVAPTLLALMGIEPPPVMTGTSLLRPDDG